VRVGKSSVEFGGRTRGDTGHAQQQGSKCGEKDKLVCAAVPRWLAGDFAPSVNTLTSP
jgi:hypothetical protein